MQLWNVGHLRTTMGFSPERKKITVESLYIYVFSIDVDPVERARKMEPEGVADLSGITYFEIKSCSVSQICNIFQFHVPLAPEWEDRKIEGTSTQNCSHLHSVILDPLPRDWGLMVRSSRDRCRMTSDRKSELIGFSQPSDILTDRFTLLTKNNFCFDFDIDYA